MGSIQSDLYSLKDSSPEIIVDRISALAASQQTLATAIRMILTPGSNGPSSVFPTNTSDVKTVQMALLGILLDEISYAPTAPQRNAGIQRVQQAAAKLHINQDELQKCSRAATGLVKIFDTH